MSLEDYRKEIDRINEDIAELVAERMEIVEEIGELKKEKGMDIKDEGREEIVKEQFADIFSSKNLSEEKGRKLAETLIGMAVKEEKEVKDK